MSLIDKLHEIDQLQQAIEKHGRLSGDVLKKVNYKFRLEWNYYSNRMEGNTLTMEETKTVMVNQLDVRGKPLKDVLEMKGHDDVIRNILQIGKGELNISESRIKELHASIMYEEAPETREKIGHWKRQPNEIINVRGEKYAFIHPNDVAEEMHVLINWINAEKEKISRKDKSATHPVLIAFRFHLEYLIIHPFYDGNGRTARILTNLILISYGFPPIYIKDNEKEDYYRILGEVQAYGADEEILYSLLSGYLIRSMNIVLNASQGKEIDEPDDIDKRIALLTKELSVKQVVNTIKSNETIYNQLKNNLVPLFEALEVKLEKLKPLFLEHARNVQFSPQDGHQIGLYSNHSGSWEVFTTTWLEENLKAGTLLLNSFHYGYTLLGFKSSLTYQNFGFNIDFRFDQYSFELKINSANPQTFSYDNPLSQAERSKIVTTIMDGLLERIENAAATK